MCVCYEWEGTKTSNYFSCFLIFFCLKGFWSGISWALLPLGKFFSILISHSMVLSSFFSKLVLFILIDLVFRYLQFF